MNRFCLRGLFFVCMALMAGGCQQAKGPAVARVGPIDISLAELKGRLEFLPLRYRTHLKARITRQIDKLRKSLEPAARPVVSRAL